MAIQQGPNNNRSNNNNRPNNNNNNFIAKSIQRHGENFIDVMNSRELQNGAIQIFRELAKGRIDIEKHGQYFLDPVFMETCLIEAQAKLSLHTINFNSTNFYVTYYQITEVAVLQVLEHNRKGMFAYNCIMGHLNNIKFSRNLNYLFTMVSNLRDYRNNI